MTEEWWIWCKRRHAKEATSVNEVTNLYQANELNQYTNINEGAVEPVYDADGNMTSYGSWQFTWDAENRLVKVSPHYLITGSRIHEYEYDYMSRRVKKTAKRYTMPMSTWTMRTFDYDGWNLIRERVEYDGAVSTNQYVWGLDLSGTLQGAGGVGGLLAILSPDSRLLTPAYDANGNITDLVDTNGSVVAHYEYDPYGNTIAKSGDQADANPFRFSSKYWDGETGFYYYGFRFYSPTLGRFINRDPLGDETFFRAFAHGKDRREKRSARQASLEPAYCFARNNAVDHYDSLGLFDPTIGARAACALGFYLANKDASGDAPECCKAKEVADKWGHCYVGCKIAFYCGIDMTMVGAVAKEIIDMFDEEDDDWSDVELDDVLASLSGIAAAESPGSCRDNCDDLICK